MRLAEAEHAALEAERELRAAAEAERDRLREAYEALEIQVELAHRRLVIARLKYRTTPPAVRTVDEIPSAADVSSATSATEVAIASATMTAPEHATGSIIELANIDTTTSASTSTMTAPEDATCSTIETANIKATASADASPVDVPPTQFAISTATPAATAALRAR